MEKKKRKRMDTGLATPGRKKILPVGPPRKKRPGEAEQTPFPQEGRPPRAGYKRSPRPEYQDPEGPPQQREERPREDRPREERPRQERPREDRPREERREESPKPKYRDFDGPPMPQGDRPRGKRPFTPRTDQPERRGPFRKPRQEGEQRPYRNFDGPPQQRNRSFDGPHSRPPRRFDGPREDRPSHFNEGGEGEFYSRKKKEYIKSKPKKNAYPNMPAAPLGEPMRLNRYISQAGVCSRRDADVLISQGKVKVNGEVVTSLGVKVDPTKDVVLVEGKEISIRHQVYLLMNKPKNFITTMEDEKGRRTVMEIVERYTRERLFPVGRLDRNTTGLLLFTNDGEMAGKLTHPSHDVRKTYHVRLDRPMAEEDMAMLQAGFELEDGFIKPDKADYVDGKGQDEIGVELHSGRNRIVRRMLEHLKYEVVALDRVAFGPLTKKELPRGTCRFLSPTEVGYLKML